MAEIDPIKITLTLNTEEFQRQMGKAKRELGRLTYAPGRWWCLLWLLWGVFWGALVTYWAVRYGGGLAWVFGVCAAIDYMCAGFWASKLLGI